MVTIVLSGLVLAGCAGDRWEHGPPDVGQAIGVEWVHVEAANLAFNPAAIALKAGEDVQFVLFNDDEVKHNLTLASLGVDHDLKAGKTSYSAIISSLKVGTYEYHCEYHPAQMQGTVTVT